MCPTGLVAVIVKLAKLKARATPRQVITHARPTNFSTWWVLLGRTCSDSHSRDDLRTASVAQSTVASRYERYHRHSRSQTTLWPIGVVIQMRSTMLNQTRQDLASSGLPAGASGGAEVGYRQSGTRQGWSSSNWLWKCFDADVICCMLLFSETGALQWAKLTNAIKKLARFPQDVFMNSMLHV